MSDLQLSVIRKWKVGKATMGELFMSLGSSFCYTLEDQVREIIGQPVESWKVQNETAIPEGTYEVVMSDSRRFRKIMPELLNVPGFGGVRIHGGNTDADTEGCVLVGHVKGNEGIHDCAAVVEKLSAIITQALTQGKVFITIKNQFA